MAPREKGEKQAMIKKVFTSWRLLFLIFAVISAIWIIQPRPWNEGVVIKSVTPDSAAATAGIEGPKSRALPMQREKIISINNAPISSIQDYYGLTTGLEPNTTLIVKTNKQIYRIITKEEFLETKLNETKTVITEEAVTHNVTINDTVQEITEIVNITKEVPKVKRTSLGTEDIGLRVDNAPTTNLLKGLDLQGGTRILLKPKETVTSEIIDVIIENLEQRLNVYGVTDVLITEVTDSLVGRGNKYILIEMAGVSEEEVKDLISRQGKFEATIGNITVFKGGGDITYVCRTPQCSGIDPRSPCGKSGDKSFCNFQFQISLHPNAAQRMAEITKKFNIVTEGSSKRLSEPLVLYLDDSEVDSLSISADLKGRVVTDISITGSGSASTSQAAQQATLDNMHQLQSVLITGSLPVKLDIVRSDTVSPILGPKFIPNALLMMVMAFAAVSLILMIYYRSVLIVIPIIVTMASEILLILAIAVLIRWNLDIASIAGIIAAVGTGVDDQIIIADETIRKREQSVRKWKERVKRAFFIIFTAFFTTVVAMIPLWFAGAGLLKGFALTTILGVTAGVFITRPAFASLTEILFEK